MFFFLSKKSELYKNVWGEEITGEWRGCGYSVDETRLSDRLLVVADSDGRWGATILVTVVEISLYFG